MVGVVEGFLSMCLVWFRKDIGGGEVLRSISMRLETLWTDVH